MIQNLTEQEIELIEAIRDFKNSRHNYSRQLEMNARILFEEMMESY